MIVAKKNAAYYLSFPAVDSSSPASYKSGVSPVDTAYYKDGAGAWTSLAITDTATEIGATGVYEIDLTAAEMNHDKVIIKFAVSGMADDAYQFDLRTQLTDDLPTAADVNAQCDTAISDASLATAAAVTTVDTVVDAIKAVTDNLPNSGALTDLATAAALTTVDTVVDRIEVDTQDIQARVPATLTAGGNMKSDVLAINGSTDSASNLQKSTITILQATATGGTTTTITTTDIAEATADHMNGRIVIFTSGTLQYQATDITDYSFSGGTATLTVTALTEAPTTEDFVVV